MPVIKTAPALWGIATQNTVQSTPTIGAMARFTTARALTTSDCTPAMAGQVGRNRGLQPHHASDLREIHRIKL